MTNKVKIAHDQTKENFLNFQINDGIGSINSTLRTALSEIGFDLSTETLQDCYSGCKVTLKNYFERLEKDLASISTPSSRSVLQKSAGSAFENFLTTVEKSLNKISGDARIYISVKDGLAVFSDDAKEKLVEDCGIYLSDPEQIERYKLHCAAAEALNSFLQGHKTPSWNMLFELMPDGTFIPALADYNYINQRIKQLKIN